MKMISQSHSKYRHELDRMKEVVDVRYLVESLGFNITRETTKELRGTCKIHGGDNKTAFRLNKETRTWICFSHNCQEAYGNDIIGLIKGSMDVDFGDAVDYLRSVVGDMGGPSLIEYERKKERTRFIKSMKPLEPPSSIVTESNLKAYRSFESHYFLKQGFPLHVLNAFEIGSGYVDSHGVIREVIPIRGDNGNLIAYSLRRIDNEEDHKYILTKEFDKDKVLYNLHRAKKYLENKPLIIVEGFKSVWRFYEYGIKNVVAVMGSKLTDGQSHLVFTYSSFNGIVIMLDGDSAGVRGTLETYRLLKGRVNKIFPITITDASADPDNLSKEEVYKYLNGFV